MTEPHVSVMNVAKPSKEIDMFPSPMEFLKSHAIAFLAGAVTVAAVQLYGRLISRQARD